MKVIETHIVPVIEKSIRLQEYAHQVFDAISTRSGIKKAIKKQQLLLNGKPANTGDWIQEGQILELLQPKTTSQKIFRLNLDILYEDEHLAIVYKIPGYPTNGNYFKTIENALPFNLSNSSEKDALPHPVPVHRLDNPTGGLLLVAKTRKTQVALSLAFERREIQKTYLAIVSGNTENFGEYSSSIDKKTALTEFQKKEIFFKNNKTFSLLLLTPHTGRTHQLRRHLSENGFPIVGDSMYGSSEKISGILLAAFTLKFVHPITQKQLNIEADLPKTFRRFLTE